MAPSKPSPDAADRLLGAISAVMHEFRIRGAKQTQSGRYLKYSATAFETLRWIDSALRPTPSGLAGFLDAPRPTVTSLLDRLENERLIARAPSTRDRRKVELSLTSRGQRAVAAIAAEDRANCSAMLSRLSRADQAVFLDLLDTIAGGNQAVERGKTRMTEKQARAPRPPRSGLLGRRASQPASEPKVDKAVSSSRDPMATERVRRRR